jgi:hypothetical protein
MERRQLRSIQRYANRKTHLGVRTYLLWKGFAYLFLALAACQFGPLLPFVT